MCYADENGLWIAFSSLTLLMIHSWFGAGAGDGEVVNCFQFINFVNDSQWMQGGVAEKVGCELLSVH